MKRGKGGAADAKWPLGAEPSSVRAEGREFLAFHDSHLPCYARTPPSPLTPPPFPPRYLKRREEGGGREHEGGERKEE